MRTLAATKALPGVSQRHRLLLLFLYIAAVLTAATASAQKPNPAADPKPVPAANPKPAPPPTPKPKPATAPKTDPAADDKLKPRRVPLKTKDGIALNAFYFPTNKEKDAITVILIHEWDGKGASPYGKFVIALRDAGCAVLAPDYRGHGGSAEYTNARGETEKFNLDQMGRRDVENVLNFDLETCKGFLKEENNAGQLNLNALVLVGIGEGCVLAGHWAQRDWAFPSVGRMKQGQDVKALIYVSPKKQIKGISIDPTLTNPQLLALPMMIVAGEAEAEEAERVSKRVKVAKTKMGKGTPSGFDMKLLPTKLSGPSLVNDVAGVSTAITDFIKKEVIISEDENPWIERD
jgi:pimeloyl-ACP methyl ester carboxylesterase